MFFQSLSCVSGRTASRPPYLAISSSPMNIRSPTMDLSKLVLPAPTSPIMQMNSPFLTLKSMFLSVIKSSIFFVFALSLPQLSASPLFSFSETSEKPQLKFPRIEMTLYSSSKNASLRPCRFVCTSSQRRNFWIRPFAIKTST